MKLPKRTSSHRNEYDSFTAFRSALPSDLFEIKEQTGGDYGTDCVVELTLDNDYSTNIVFCVQGKSKQEGKRNSDSTLSYPVDCSTVNYLMNRPCSIFFIYLVSERVFVWDWVSNIWKSALERGVDTKTSDQDTVTHRFSRTFTDVEFREIHRKVIESSNLVRRVSELVTMCSPSGSNAIIDLKAMEVHDPEGIKKALLTDGISLASCGRTDLVDLVFSRLPATHYTARICYVMSYNSYIKGAAFESMSWLTRADGYAQDVSDYYQQLRTLIRTNVELTIGLITRAEYEERLMGAESDFSGTVFSLRMRLERLKSRVYSTRRSEELQGNIEDLKQAAVSILEREDATDHERFLAKAAKWEFEGLEFNFELTRTASDFKIRDKIGKSIDIRTRVQTGVKLLEMGAEWYRRGFELKKEAKGYDNLLFVAEVVLSEAATLLSLDMCTRSMAAISEHPETVDLVNVASLLTDLKSTAELLEKHSCLEAAVKANVLLAQANRVTKDLETAEKYATKAEELARRTGSQSLMGAGDIG